MLVLGRDLERTWQVIEPAFQVLSGQADELKLAVLAWPARNRARDWILLGPR